MYYDLGLTPILTCASLVVIFLLSLCIRFRHLQSLTLKNKPKEMLKKLKPSKNSSGSRK